MSATLDTIERTLGQSRGLVERYKSIQGDDAMQSAPLLLRIGYLEAVTVTLALARAGLEYHAAHSVVEEGLTSFDLHAAAVERLKEADAAFRAARDQLYVLDASLTSPR